MKPGVVSPPAGKETNGPVPPLSHKSLPKYMRGVRARGANRLTPLFFNVECKESIELVREHVQEEERWSKSRSPRAIHTNMFRGSGDLRVREAG